MAGAAGHFFVQYVQVLFMENQDSLETFWDNLLSRDPALIRAAFSSLDKESQKMVLAHLERMVSEDGWHAEQVKSAQAALDAIKPTSPAFNDE